MSSIIDALYDLKYNPFEYGPHIASFYSAVGQHEDNILLSSLVIPLCSHPIFKNKLSNSNVRSTIWTVFDDPSKHYDLQDRIKNFQDLTTLSIEYCLVNDWLIVDEKKLSFCVNPKLDPFFTVEKSAQKLGRLFYGRSVVEIFAFLGVKPR